MPCAELTRALDIPVIGGEVLAKRPYALADYCARRVVDGVRADVSWSGGVTGTLEDRPSGRSIPHALRNSYRHLSPAGNGEPACLRCHPQFGIGSKCCGRWTAFPLACRGGLPIEDGMATLPQAPGLGAALDRDAIENATLEVF
ncbi:MAG: enolase C-terminal domain-like protein [Cypionkella sp.]